MENMSYLKFLTNRNIFYDISLSHNQKRVFVLVSIGRKVPQSTFCAWVYSCSDTINSSRQEHSQVVDKGKFEKKRASGNYVLPSFENCHCAFPLV